MIYFQHEQPAALNCISLGCGSVYFAMVYEENTSDNFEAVKARLSTIRIGNN